MEDTIKLLDLQHRHSPFPFLGDLLKEQVEEIHQRQGGVLAQAPLMVSYSAERVLQGGSNVPIGSMLCSAFPLHYVNSCVPDGACLLAQCISPAPSCVSAWLVPPYSDWRPDVPTTPDPKL